MPPSLMANRVSLLELADLAIGTPEVGAVNFTALHTLIVSILKSLNLQEVLIDFHSPSAETGRGAELMRPTYSAPHVSTSKERRRSLPRLFQTQQELESQVKDLGTQVLDLTKQLKTMDNQVQRMATQIDHISTSPERQQEFSRLEEEVAPVAQQISPTKFSKIYEYEEILEKSEPTGKMPTQVVQLKSLRTPSLTKSMSVLQDLIEDVKILKQAPELQELLQRFNELEKLVKSREEYLDQLSRRLNLAPGGEEITMVTWEELEQVISDGWKASKGLCVFQDTCVESEDNPKEVVPSFYHMGARGCTQSSDSSSTTFGKHKFASSDFLPSGMFPRAADQVLESTGGIGQPPERVSSRDQSRSTITFRDMTREPSQVISETQQGKDQRGGIPGLEPLGMDQPGLIYPVMPLTTGQLSVMPPEMYGQGSVPLDIDQSHVLPPSGPVKELEKLSATQLGTISTYQQDMVLPGTDQEGTGQVAMYDSGQGPWALTQQGLTPGGIDQRGPTPHRVDQQGLVKPGVDQRAFPPSLPDQRGMVSLGLMQVSADQQGFRQSSLTRFIQPGIEQGGVEQRDLARPGLDRHSSVPVGTERRPSLQAVADRRSSVPIEAEQQSLAQSRAGSVQPEAGRRGLVQPGVDQRSAPQPGADQRGLGQPSTDWGGLIQPGTDQHLGPPGAGQPSLIQPGAFPPSLAQLGLGQQGLIQPDTGQPDWVQPGTDQRDWVQPGAYLPGWVQSGADQPGLVPVGMDQRGLVQSGTDWSSVQPGVDHLDMAQPHAVQPGMVPQGAVQPGMVPQGAGQPGMLQPGIGQHGLVQPGALPSGWGQPDAYLPGLVQPGVGQYVLVQPRADQYGFVQPGVAHGLLQPNDSQRALMQTGVGQVEWIQPGMGRRDLVQPGSDESGLVQRGMARQGVAQPGKARQGVAQPGKSRHGVAQPDMAQQGVAQPGEFDLAQPIVDQSGFVQPGMDQRGLVQPRMYQYGFVEPSELQRNFMQPRAVPPRLVQPGMDQRGLVQPIMDQSGLLQPGTAVQHGLVQPGLDQHDSLQRPGEEKQELLQPGLDQRHSPKPGKEKPDLLQPEADQPGLLQPRTAGFDMMQPGMAEPGAGLHVLGQPDSGPQGLDQPSAYAPSLAPAGGYPPAFIQPGIFPSGTFQPATFPPATLPHGFRQPTPSQPDLVIPSIDLHFPTLEGEAHQPQLPRLHQLPELPPMQDQARKEIEVVCQIPDKKVETVTVEVQYDAEQAGPGYPEQVQRVEVDTQVSWDLSKPESVTQFGSAAPEQVISDSGTQDAWSYFQQFSSASETPRRERQESLEKLAPSFPMAVETFRLIGELIALYLELKEQLKGLGEEQAGLTDFEKIQYLITTIVKKSVPQDLPEQLKSLQMLNKEVRQDKAKLDKIQKFLDTDISGGKEVKPSHLSLQLGILRVTVSEIEKELIELRESQDRGKAAMENSVSEASLYLQDQLDKLRTIIESMLSSSSTLLSMSITPHKFSAGLVPDQIDPEATCPACSLDVSHQVSLLVQRYEQLQDMVSGLAASRPSKKAKLQSQDEELLGHVQSAILQVQGDCEKLNITTSNLIEVHQQKQKDIEVLYQGIERLEKEKADKEHLEMEIDVKADKSALASKVSRIQFDATTEQLNHMMQELVAKMSGQEQDWQKLLDKLLAEMDSKLDRLELDPLKQMLEDRWKSLRQQLKERSPLYQADEAAAMRRQLLAHFHCLSCDRPLETTVTGQVISMTPIIPSMPGHRSVRPYTVFELEQIRQQSRNLKLGGGFPRGDLSQMEKSVGRLRSMHSKMLMDIEKVQIHFGGSVKASSQMIRELLHAQCLSQPCYKRGADTANYTYSTVPRRCGGSHTLTYPYRRNRPQHLSPLEEIQIAMKHDEVDILGLDGHIYKGRMDTRLPGILGKDAPGMAKHNKAKLQQLQQLHQIQQLQQAQHARPHTHRQPNMGNTGTPPSLPQSAQMLADSDAAPSGQKKDRPLSSEGSLLQSTTSHPSMPTDMASLQGGQSGLNMHMDVPPGEGLEEPTRGPRSTTAH